MPAWKFFFRKKDFRGFLSFQRKIFAVFFLSKEKYATFA